MKQYDIIIVGGGPAGLSAAVYAGQAGLKTLVIEEANSLLLEAPHVTNYLGYESISGSELLNKFKDHAKKTENIDFIFDNVKEITKEREVITSKNKYTPKAIIVASGAGHRKLGIKGEREFAGRGVSYCAICDGNFFRGKTVAVIGGGNSAFSEAIYLKKLATKVYLIHRRKEFRANQNLIQMAKNQGIEVLTPFIAQEIRGDQLVKDMIIKNVETNEEKVLQVNGIFISIGEEPQTSFLKDLGVSMTEKREIIINEDMQTNIPWLFAAGDVTNSNLKQVITAVADGARAAASARKFIENSAENKIYGK